MIVMCVLWLTLSLLVLALGATVVVCWMAGLTFSWSIVALIWLVLLIVAVALDG